MVEMRRRQRSAVGIERLPGSSTLLAAPLAAPRGAVLHTPCSIFPVVRIELSVHRHRTISSIQPCPIARPTAVGQCDERRDVLIDATYIVGQILQRYKMDVAVPTLHNQVQR